ncbi:MAG: hypothetical protein JXR82_07165 [Marinifilaceae bacterium]|nr:hypothetical protein [Marinifilaceae bacterium]
MNHEHPSHVAKEVDKLEFLLAKCSRRSNLAKTVGKLPSYKLETVISVGKMLPTIKFG